MYPLFHVLDNKAIISIYFLKATVDNFRPFYSDITYIYKFELVKKFI